MAQHTDTNPDRSRQLRRSSNDRMLSGTAAGIADWLGTDPTVIRVAFAALAALGGAGLPIYLAAWLLVPEEGSELSIADDLLHRTSWH